MTKDNQKVPNVSIISVLTLGPKTVDEVTGEVMWCTRVCKMVCKFVD